MIKSESLSYDATMGKPGVLALEEANSKFMRRRVTGVTLRCDL